MSQIEQIQACIQVEAAQELKALVRPLVQKIIRSARNRHVARNVTETAPSPITRQFPVEPPIERAQVRES